MDDDKATILSREVAKEIEEKMQYPGQIKVTVIRETRAIEYAKQIKQMKWSRLTAFILYKDKIK